MIKFKEILKINVGPDDLCLCLGVCGEPGITIYLEDGGITLDKLQASILGKALLNWSEQELHES